MDFNKLPIIQAITGKMDWLNERQNVLSGNLANSDTAGYTPRDLREVDFGAELKGVLSGRFSNTMSASAQHQAYLRSAQEQAAHSGERARRYDAIETKGIETTPNGNSVVLEEQLIKVAETQIEYTAMSNLYRKQADLIRLAVSSR